MTDTVTTDAMRKGDTTIPTGTGAGATAYGYPRQGRDRQLKRALESHWRGAIDVDQLLEVAGRVRHERLSVLAGAGLTELPAGDFSLYDHVLDTALMLGVVPARFSGLARGPEPVQRLGLYFAMARGTAEVAPLEMTKWFDTNYHYLVPELSADTGFALDPAELLAQVDEAAALGLPVRPVVVGPVTFLALSKSADDPGFRPLDLLGRLLPVYADLLARLAAAGVEWVQLDEPIAVTDLTAAELRELGNAYRVLSTQTQRPKLLVATYFGHLGDAASVLVRSGIDGLGADFTGPGAANLGLLAVVPELASKRLIAGLVDGRNVWRTDLAGALATAGTLLGLAGHLDLAPSCSLLHVPHDVSREKRLDPQVASWLAFADQKLDEVATLARGLREGSSAVAAELQLNTAALATRRGSSIAVNPAARQRAAEVSAADLTRRSPYAQRAAGQHERLQLPPLPTTTIGSFPQISDVRRARADRRNGTLSEAGYQAAMRSEIDRVVALQEDLGLDLLVHGEPERNDMVQYFAEQLSGVVTTEHGWVQSYGSRCVRPPIVVGDISRPEPMTVAWSRYARSRTTKPVKGMLTGPVTMLAWSFVRDDQPMAETARQLALALRDEVLDLEAAGVAAIQVDEPALRETLPLRTDERADYLRWAVDAFRLATAGVADQTQIHTHMCYAEFGDIVSAIVELDADVISLEAARSKMEVVAELAAAGYPREVGPGVWDIHSPRIPTTAELADGLGLAVGYLPAERIWVNPDCGLKTRTYAEVEPALRNLVAAAHKVRSEITTSR